MMFEGVLNIVIGGKLLCCDVKRKFIINGNS